VSHVVLESRERDLNELTTIDEKLTRDVRSRI